MNKFSKEDLRNPFVKRFLSVPLEHENRYLNDLKEAYEILIASKSKYEFPTQEVELEGM